MQDFKTLDYYNQKTKEFVDATVDVDFSVTQEKFLRYLSKGAHILDFGCGSGRDTKYFLEQGFRVTATDGSEELCKFASTFTGIEVRQLYFQELAEVEAFDGIWACSSILHLLYEELQEVFLKMVRALKGGGVIYTSFKYGTFEGERNGRYFTDMDEAKFKTFLQQIPDLQLKELWIAEDVRPERSTERWLNIILKKR